MAHIYDVRFHTELDKCFTIYGIHVKANNQKEAKEIAQKLWKNKYEVLPLKRTCKLKIPHMFHLSAKRTSDSAIEDGFHSLAHAQYIPYHTQIDWGLETPCTPHQRMKFYSPSNNP